MVLMLLLALLDIVAGIFTLTLHNPILPSIAKYIGIILLVKGFWSLVVGWRSI